MGEEAFYTLHFKTNEGAWYVFGDYDHLKDAIRRGEKSFDVPFRIIKWVSQGIVYEQEF